MLSVIFKLLTNDVFTKVMSTVKDIIVESKQKDVDEAEVEAKVKAAILEAYAEGTKAQANVLVAEAKGEDWLQRNWRGMLGLSFGFVFLFWAVLVPGLVAWAGVEPPRVGDLLLNWIFTLTSIALGGGIGGATLVEITKALKR